MLVRDVAIAPPELGDVLVTPATGAYGYAMANNYNGQPRPAVVMVAGGEAHVIIARETWDDVRACSAAGGRAGRAQLGDARGARRQPAPTTGLPQITALTKGRRWTRSASDLWGTAR